MKSKAPSRRFLLEVAKITNRELEVANLVATGLNNKSIAKHLGVATKTIEAHLYNIFSKLDIMTRAAMVVLLAQLDLINISEVIVEHRNG